MFADVRKCVHPVAVLGRSRSERHPSNVNTAEAPHDRKPGDDPALSDDVIEFPKTLDDGFEP